ncbi:lipoyl-[GcvH]:protein N-lipoyltransferase [Barrientosiimonas marina]|uniref:Octanoyl-[GcvH]:protein N-octanoyltransferase n=1 Tax=Lentibacillus kimchii TaxID=1542911 RepID=A0ABW2UXB5_9BACI
MKNWRDVVTHSQFRLFDHTEKNYFHDIAYTALTSFAVDDALALFPGSKEKVPALRLWVHPDTIVLGITDTKLPYLEKGIHLLHKRGYPAVVRNSGGLAVALDAGVLNISLVLPDVRHISIYDCYEAMVSFIRYVLADLTDEIEAYEIARSYCPGDYDLSINGRKFAGISQRRVKNGASVQIYLDVEGSSQERAKLVRDFYDAAGKDEATRFTYPDIDPSVMASLSQLLGRDLRVGDIKRRVLHVLDEVSEQVVTDDISEEELTQFEKRYKQMMKRNEDVAAMQ